MAAGLRDPRLQPGVESAVLVHRLRHLPGGSGREQVALSPSRPARRIRDNRATEDAMETWDAIRARRNVRNCLPDPIADGMIEPDRRGGLAGTVGIKSPAVGLRDRHRSRPTPENSSTVWRGAGRIASAPAAIALVVPAPSDERAKLIDQCDLGRATPAMAIAATDLGIGSGHSSVGDQDKAREILGVPDDHLVSTCSGSDARADRPFKPIDRPDRRPFEEVVHRGRW